MIVKHVFVIFLSRFLDLWITTKVGFLNRHFVLGLISQWSSSVNIFGKALSETAETETGAGSVTAIGAPETVSSSSSKKRSPVYQYFTEQPGSNWQCNLCPYVSQKFIIYQQD